MRHREQITPLDALADYKNLRRKVEQEGGQHYDKPVLVRFADKGTFEVMDRDIVEDEFYVRRVFKIVRELDPKGADLEQALREHRGDGRQPSQRGPQQRRPGGSGREGGRDRSQRGPKGAGNSRRGGRSRRGSRRGGGGGGNRPQGGPPSTPPAAT
jgi:hypothetical protein